MYPPPQNFNLDLEALSGILGSVSIAAWIVVFSPQIITNWRRGSADGLSIIFLITWLAGDVFNVLGAVLQGVLPTMVILAVYYTLADIVLLGQFFFYEGFRFKDEVQKPNVTNPDDRPDEESPLLQPPSNGHQNGHSNGPARISDIERRRSSSSFRERFLSVDGTHLSPVTPLVNTAEPDPHPISKVFTQPSPVIAFFYNLGAVLLVIFAGILGWWLSERASNSHRGSHPDTPKHNSETLHFNILGQVFGYICAALYLGSRIPQLLLNYRRKSTDGISLLFFLFACIGNLTYVLSIFAYSPVCKSPGHCQDGEARAIYGRYIAVNFSWFLGSFGTLLLDAGVFVQFFLYKKDEETEESRGRAVVE
ncbi:PQ loop repeat protein [Aulographum hederae CBS 113979]|uniref:PQ loop repeat protein n=1 Tax=Aulographum hederae CBS 113979 TaxID=1176131 RepID=A0A6G1HD41_9PEZI|nr:PQ loop repeat protein [Aulographum hederae CBS 113979]